jgi:hypothetical protein
VIDFIWFTTVFLTCPFLAMREFWSVVKKSTDGRVSSPNVQADGRIHWNPSRSQCPASRLSTPSFKKSSGVPLDLSLGIFPRPESKMATPWVNLQPMEEYSPRFEDDGNNSQDYE